jgi:hypothetical protein
MALAISNCTCGSGGMAVRMRGRCAIAALLRPIRGLAD